MLTYNAELEGISENLENLREILCWHQHTYNSASVKWFCQGLNLKNSIKDFHNLFYEEFRKSNTWVPSQVVIRAEQECLSAYRSVKSNKHKIWKPIKKKKLSMRLDKRLYSQKDKNDKTKIWITTSKGRQEFKIKGYSKLNELMSKHCFCDPLIFERNGKIYISLTFDIPVTESKQKSCLGVDLGKRISAACSDGRLIRDKKYNKRQRKLRYQKRQLQKKNTKSAKRKLKKIRRKEQNRSVNQTHLIVNEILKTDADVIVIEDLTKIKAKKKKYQNKNSISQVPFYRIRQVLSYKARMLSKHLVVINPAYTSQTDSITHKKDGTRKGRRYYSKSGLIYDSDVNASINIAQKSDLPLSPPICKNWMLDGAGRIVNLPNVDAKASSDVCESLSPILVHYKPCPLGQGS